MKNLLNLLIVGGIFITLILGCSGANKNAATSTTSSAPATNSAAAPTEKPIAVQAKALTKEYDENELAADAKYKDKMLAVSGKVSNIAETMGNVTVQLEGYNIAKNVMCSFDEAEKANVAKLKKGQQVTLIGKGDGSTAGLYIGLQGCKTQ